jgi:hypothetical protein
VRHRAVAKQAAGGATDPGLALLESATLWLDAAQEPQTGTMPQWALNRGTGAVGHARIGSAGKAELRGSAGLILPGIASNYASTPDSTALDITGDFEIVFRYSHESWTFGGEHAIAKRGAGGCNYQIYWQSTTIGFFNGITTHTEIFTGIFQPGVTYWIKYNIVSGLGRFYYAADQETEPSSWTGLGSSKIISIGAVNSEALKIGWNGVTAGYSHSGSHYRVIIRGSGTTVFDADFTAATPFATSFIESSSNAATVTINSTTGVDTNDPLLLTHDGSTNYLYLPGAASNYASTSTAPSNPTEADVRLRLSLADWTPSDVHMFSGTVDRGKFYVKSTGFLAVYDGVAERISSSAPTVSDGGTIWIRYTFSSGTYTFYWAADQPSVPFSWTSLGSSGGGVANSPQWGSGLRIGSNYNGALTMSGTIYRCLVYSDLTETTKVIDADFTTNTNQSSFTESSSNAATVTINRATSGRKSVMVTRPVWLFGTDDYMEIADNDLLDFALADSFTVLAVARRHHSAAQALVTKNLSLSTDGWALLPWSSPDFIADLRSSGASDVQDTQTGFSAGTAQLLSMVRNVTADEITIFVGTTGTATTDTTTGTLANTTPMRVGTFGTASNYYEGEIVAVAVFRSALTSTELGQIADYYGV